MYIDTCGMEKGYVGWVSTFGYKMVRYFPLGSLKYDLHALHRSFHIKLAQFPHIITQNLTLFPKVIHQNGKQANHSGVGVPVRQWQFGTVQVQFAGRQERCHFSDRIAGVQYDMALRRAGARHDRLLGG